MLLIAQTRWQHTFNTLVCLHQHVCVPTCATVPYRYGWLPLYWPVCLAGQWRWWMLMLMLMYLFPPLDLSEVEPNIFLRPFLEVVRSEDTTGPITGLALTSVNKFLSYGLIGKISRSALLLFFIFLWLFFEHISMLLSMCADLTTMVQSLF